MSKLFSPFVLVPQQNIMILERFGKFVKVLQPGLQFKLPIFDFISYHHSLKEQVLDIDSQTAITKDNVKIKIDGVLYFKITDPYKASYEVSQPIRAISLLAQTSMRSEIGRIDLDRTFLERESLNAHIKASLNEASVKWGIECMRYEIKDIKPPEEIRRSMELQAESERIKRSKILTSEGERESKINIAEGIKQAAILEGQGTASKILQEARGICESLERISSAIESGGKGEDALRLKLTEQYIEALNEILARSKVLMIPLTDAKNTAPGQWSVEQVASALSLFKTILGSGGPSILNAVNQQQPDLLNEVQKKLKQLESLNQGGQGAARRDRAASAAQSGGRGGYQYHDDKALYSE